jgi:hypothetical protein
MKHLMNATATLKDLEDTETLQHPHSEHDDYPGLEPRLSSELGWLIEISEAAFDNAKSLNLDEETKARVRRSGMDALAWYRPFHPVAYGLEGNWGIYIRNSGIEMLARRQWEAGVDLHASITNAITFLFRHEATHFEHELRASQAEVLAQRPFYLRQIQQKKMSLQKYSLVMEGLANHEALRWLEKEGRKILASWEREGLPGYNDFSRHTFALRARSWAEVFTDFLGGQYVAGVQTQDLVAARETYSRVAKLSRVEFENLLSQVPVYFVPDGSGPDGQIAGAYFGPVAPIELSAFTRDLSKRGDPREMSRAWEATKRKLSEGSLTSSVHLEKLHGFSQAVHSVRLLLRRGGGRAILVRDDSTWYAVLADQDHDSAYLRAKGAQPFRLVP